jgi:hypothetical protein
LFTAQKNELERIDRILADNQNFLSLLLRISREEATLTWANKVRDRIERIDLIKDVIQLRQKQLLEWSSQMPSEC